MAKNMHLHLCLNNLSIQILTADMLASGLITNHVGGAMCDQNFSIAGNQIPMFFDLYPSLPVEGHVAKRGLDWASPDLYALNFASRII